MKADVSNLGDLEMAVLEYVWQNGPSDIKEAHSQIGVERGITHNTVQSTFKRLWKKGLLSRSKQSHAHIYTARVDRCQLTELMVGQLVEQVAGHEPEVAIEAFVNFADNAGDETFAALEELVAARRRSQNPKQGKS